MPSQWHGLRPPFRLPSGIVYFHDWRYVSHGHFAWRGSGGEAVPMWGLDPHPPMHLEHHDLPLGIRLVAQPACKSEPVLTPEQTGELFLFGGTVIYEQGRYRLWYDCWPREDMTDQARMGNYNLLRYAESDNGTDWRLPELGLVEYRDSKRNNLVYGGPLTPRTGYHGGCVFRDPAGPEGERYKAFHLGSLDQEGLARYRVRWPGDVDPFHLHTTRVPALFGAVSPDGLRWTPLPEPLLVQTSDTHNVCEYDSARGTYVAYCRSWYWNRRTIGRSESPDFRHFPLPEELIWPDAGQEPYDLWYANAKTRMPGAPDYHLMFPLRWRLLDDSFEFHLASSPDGVVWSMVPGGPVCQPGEPGAWDGGVVAPGLGLVELPGERMGILVAGSPVPHKHPRRPPLGALAWAWWPRGRLVALRADTEGAFALWPLLLEGRQVVLNAKTAPAGHVLVEVAGEDGKPLPGRSFAECDGVSGDHLAQVVTWRGQPGLEQAQGDAVTLRFRLRRADLYSVSLVAG